MRAKRSVLMWLGAVLSLPAVAQQESKLRVEPGLRVCGYEVGVPLQQLPELARGQLPNTVKILPTIDLDSTRGDFSDFKGSVLTEVTGFLNVTPAGPYTLRLLSDDGARLWLDDRRVIDHDGLHGPTAKDATIELTAGPHRFRLWHFDAGGGARLALLWKTPGTATGADFVVIPEPALTHDAAVSRETAPGPKRVIPALRRGRPGDGSPVAGMHPSLALGAGRPGSWATMRDLRVRVVATPPTDGDITSVVWFPPSDRGCIVTTPRTLHLAPYQEQIVVGNSVTGELVRFYVEPIGETHQGCAFQFSAGHPAGFKDLFTSDDGSVVIASWGAGEGVAGGAIRASFLVSSKKFPFEMLAVRALANGLEVQFTQPLDPRAGWDADSYYVEQWPYDLSTLVGPWRDGSTTPVKSASVSSDRHKVFLEIPGLKPSHVIYLRLLPPCLSEKGELPWSTEAWYTLQEIPQDRTGQVMAPPSQPPQNVLTDEERQAGWKLLFDGQATQGWHGWKRDRVPDGWQVIDGCLARVGPAGDIVTDEEFDNFELALEWRISAGGNSGIFFRVDEQHKYPWETGPEVQVLDNTEHADGRNSKTSAGANYALHAPARDVTQPVGLFNQVRIVASGNHVEHWLNGVKIVEYEVGSPEWEKLVADSKFAKMPHYGRESKGHIALQDHGDKVWYRNLKIRPLKSD